MLFKNRGICFDMLTKLFKFVGSLNDNAACHEDDLREPA